MIVYNLLEALGGLKAHIKFTLDNYDNKDVIKQCSGYPKQNIFLYGKAGTGKTHLATALVRDKFACLVVKPAHIFRKCRGINGNEEQAVIEYFTNIPHLVIDDLATEKQTEFSASILLEIIEARDMGCKTGLIITSNLSLDDLSIRIGDDRLSSRLAGMCKIVEIIGKDRRLQGMR